MSDTATSTGPIEHLTRTPVATDAPVVLEVADLAVTFRGSGRRREPVRAVDGVSLTLHRGETLGLVGESGSGKSTLVRTLFGLNAPTRGSIRILDQDPNALNGRDLRRLRNRMQMVFQDPYSSLNPRLTTHDIVAEPLRLMGRYDRGRVIQLLADVGLGEDVLGRRPAQFSGGQRQRIGIARALALNPEILVLDEPVSALDVSVQAQVINLLIRLQEQHGLSYLFIAHDLSVVRHLSDRIAVMRAGQIVETGPAERVFHHPEDAYTRELLAAIPIPDPHRRGALTGAIPTPTPGTAGPRPGTLGLADSRRDGSAGPLSSAA
ncbi:ATP-binding cassette domain-containing protein [Mycetocola saprophilus]|uniref:ATP-binding cassette domain-containing protein n=1 Tax=Mycetocola saprophilus TaxID=76636 RepID=UPI003BF2ECC1